MTSNHKTFLKDLICDECNQKNSYMEKMKNRNDNTHLTPHNPKKKSNHEEERKKEKLKLKESSHRV